MSRSELVTRTGYFFWLTIGRFVAIVAFLLALSGLLNVLSDAS